MKERSEIGGQMIGDEIEREEGEINRNDCWITVDLRKRKKIRKKECYKFALSSITIVCRLGKLNSLRALCF